MSSAFGILISPSPTAMPSPVVPFDTPMESCTSQATSLWRLVRIEHRVDGEQRRLGLHIMHVGRIGDAGVAHGGAHALGDFLHHRRPADILRENLGAHGGADDQPRFVRRAGLGVAREHGRVRRDHAVAAARPDHRDFCDLGFGAAAVLFQHRAKRLVGEDAGEIVDAAIAFGLADDGDHLVRLELSVADAGLHAGSVLHVLQFDLGDFNSHYPKSSLFLVAAIPALAAAASVEMERSLGGSTLRIPLPACGEREQPACKTAAHCRLPR